MIHQRQRAIAALILLGALFVSIPCLHGQADQGSISGIIQDPTGAVIGGASVTLTSLDTNQELKTKASGDGAYVFTPVKIGNYKVTASADGFATTTETNLHVSAQQRLNVVVSLKPGTATETVTVTSEQLVLQTQDASVGETISTDVINDVPLNGRNWVYIAQLTPGAAPSNGARGSGKGDFNANGQRAEQNNFVLDGVDNNANVVDFYNGASYVAQPPPDALSEFSVQTSNYSAEFGHSAGAVVNASIKSGTNDIHGSAWEYFRNTALDATDWNATKPQPYHENQFGATLGLPVLKNKLFFFGDIQANRVSFDEVSTLTVPSMKERLGDFSELLNPNLTGNGGAIQLFYQDPVNGPIPFANNNLFSIPGVAPNSTAMNILSLFPQPNTNGGLLYDNYYVTRPATENTVQWDMRMDWVITGKDTAYARYSYWNEVGYRTPPLGNILDGGYFGDDGSQKIFGQNFMLSETHVFTPSLTNEFRFGYNWMHTGFLQPNANNPNLAASIGLGGVPGGAYNGGLPYFQVAGISNFGSSGYAPTNEYENVYQFLDNVSKVWGKHTIKAGANIQSIRFSTLQPQASRGIYTYTGQYTSALNAQNTGYGLADFAMDSQYNAQLSNIVNTQNSRWYYALYAQDDWRATRKLTFNLGVRWDYFQPYKELSGFQASFNNTGPSHISTDLTDPMVGIGQGSGQYLMPTQSKAYADGVFGATGGAFQQALQAMNITQSYTSNPALITAQKTNFSPRIGISYQLYDNTVIRAGYGIFFGGLESQGYYPNLGQNYPYQYVGNFPSGGCSSTSCATNGINLATGFAPYGGPVGILSQVFGLFLRGSDPVAKTPYTQNYNLSIEQGFGKNTYLTFGYVGSNSHHLQVNPDPNAPLALENPSNWAQYARPFPYFGPFAYTAYAGNSNYNSLQAKLQKSMSNGLSLLASYTWSHSLDDAPTPLGTNGDGGYRQSNLIPISMDYSNSGFDVRQRITFNAVYQLPFGLGRKYMNQSGAVNAIFGRWSTDVTFTAMTGNPFTVTLPSSFPLASGAGPNYGPYVATGVLVGNPNTPGGTFQSPNPNNQVACASSTRNREHWYNPCAFTYPWNPNDPVYELQHYIPTGPSDPYFGVSPNSMFITDTAQAIGYIGGVRNNVYGPGFNRFNMSLFKDFTIFREQTLQFRTDIFNLFNHPSLGQPSDSTVSSNGGRITTPRFTQNLTPDARFFQLSLKYTF